MGRAFDGEKVVWQFWRGTAPVTKANAAGVRWVEHVSWAGGHRTVDGSALTDPLVPSLERRLVDGARLARVRAAAERIA